MLIDISREELIILLNNLHLPIELCEEFTKLKYMEFCGDQHNLSWKFTDEFLSDKRDEDIYANYQFLKNNLD
jgi:hypothetical protein